MKKQFLLILLSGLFFATSCVKDNGEDDQFIIAEEIQGEWVRVESNNPENDNMVVKIVSFDGIIINKGQSPTFEVGDVKWKNISSTGNNAFSYEELGSDNAYYASVMTVVNDSTLELSVGSSGAGNVQKWIKSGTGNVSGPVSTQTLDCNGFTVAQTLTNGPAEIDYMVSANCVLDVREALTIEPGVVIAFGENAGIGVYDNGSINAVGTEDDPIVFMGSTASRGYWRGIHIETNSINNQLKHVSVKDAGSNYVYCCNVVASVFIKGGQLAIANSTIENGGGAGLYANSAAELVDFENVSIKTHDEYPLSISLARAAELDGLASDFSGNEKNYIQILDANLSTEASIEACNVPFLVDDVLDITEGLTLLEGVEIVMRENAGIGVYDNGYLNIQGSSGNMVRIRGYEAVQGYWRGIHMETSSLKNDIAYAAISDAGSNYVYCCNNAASIYLKNGKASINHTQISNGAAYGVATGSAFQFVSFSSNSISTHKKYPMYIQGNVLTEIASDNVFTGNDKDFIAIYNSKIDNDAYWRWNETPYLIETGAVIDITASLSIEPGTEIVFEENAGLGVYDNGVFNAQSNSGQPIIFRGLTDVVGFWRGIHIETNSIDNVLNYCNVLNAGSNYVYCCNAKAAVFLKSGQLKITNSFISKSGGCGVNVKSGASLTESGNTFSANTDGHICN